MVFVLVVFVLSHFARLWMFNGCLSTPDGVIIFWSTMVSSSSRCALGYFLEFDVVFFSVKKLGNLANELSTLWTMRISPYENVLELSYYERVNHVYTLFEKSRVHGVVLVF